MLMYNHITCRYRGLTINQPHRAVGCVGVPTLLWFGMRGIAAARRSGGGSNMRRVLAVAIAGAGLASSLGGCSSFSLGTVTDYFKSTPPSIQVQLESTPPGAEAKTSLGPGC